MKSGGGGAYNFDRQFAKVVLKYLERLVAILTV